MEQQNQQSTTSILRKLSGEQNHPGLTWDFCFNFFNKYYLQMQIIIEIKCYNNIGVL